MKSVTQILPDETATENLINPDTISRVFPEVILDGLTVKGFTGRTCIKFVDGSFIIVTNRLGDFRDN